ncbi:hypothetical protein BH23ACT6_BH23ACT6_02690 [soil metagenome]
MVTVAGVVIGGTAAVMRAAGVVIGGTPAVGVATAKTETGAIVGILAMSRLVSDVSATTSRGTATPGRTVDPNIRSTPFVATSRTSKGGPTATTCARLGAGPVTEIELLQS